MAREDARFGEPEIRYGSGPVTLLMPFVLGQKKTNELLFTGDAIAAAEAERCGLVNRVVAADELEAAAQELALRIAPTPLARAAPDQARAQPRLRGDGPAPGGRARTSTSPRCSTPPRRPSSASSTRSCATQGLKAALRWRDSRYGQALSAGG